MIKAEAIKNLTKEQLEEMYLTLMHNDHEKAKIIENLENNWNELKEWLESKLDDPKDFWSVLSIKDILEKMQEIESRK